MFLHKWTNVLSPARLQEFQDKIIGNPSLSASDESSRYVRWCVEGNPPEADEFLSEIEPLVKEVYTDLLNTLTLRQNLYERWLDGCPY